MSDLEPKRKQRTEFQREHDLQLTASLYLQGKTQQEIAGVIGVSRSQIGYDLDEIRERWLTSSIRDFDQARAEALAKIDLLEREAWLAWEQSKVIEFEAANNRIERGKPKLRPGDIRYWQAAHAANQERNKLLSLYGAEKIDAIVRSASVNIVRDVSTLTDQEIEREIAKMAHVNTALMNVGKPLPALTGNVNITVLDSEESASVDQDQID